MPFRRRRRPGGSPEAEAARQAIVKGWNAAGVAASLTHRTLAAVR